MPYVKAILQAAEPEPVYFDLVNEMQVYWFGNPLWARLLLEYDLIMKPL